MRNSYYNASHCADPTAYAAIENITREERSGVNCCVNCRSRSFTHVNCCVNCGSHSFTYRPPKKNRDQRRSGRRRR